MSPAFQKPFRHSAGPINEWRGVWKITTAYINSVAFTLIDKTPFDSKWLFLIDYSPT